MRISVFVAAAAFSYAAACSAAGDSDANDAVAVTTFSLPAGENAVHFADLNGDGFLDMLSASEARGEVSVRLGDGTGKFASPSHYPAGDWPTSLDSADLNADGRTDIVVANHEQPFLTILLGDGDGGLSKRETIALPEQISPHVHLVRAVDVDGDGAPDLIVDSRDHRGVFALLAEPRLRFRPQPIDVGGSPYLGFAVGDMNADSAPDLVTPNEHDVSILLNVRQASLRFVIEQHVPIRSPFAVALADFDGDGNADLVVASEAEAAGLSIFLNDGSGRIGERAAARFEMPAGAKTLGVGDINGDGRDDIVATAWSGDLLVVVGDRDHPRILRPPLQGLTAPWSIAIGDINGDQRDDLMIADGESGRANLYSWPAGSTDF